MTYFATNPFASAPKGQPRQGANPHRPNPNDSAKVSPRSTNNLRASRDRMPHGVSFNLVSLVTKFEALDALSLPVTSPSLQPAPLHISRKSSRQKDGRGSRYRRRLSTIFSPKRGSTENHDPGLSEEDIQARQVDIFGVSNSRKFGSLDKMIDARKLRKSQTSNKPSSVRSRGGVWDPADAVHGREIGAVAAPYVQNETQDEKKRGSIKDRISFYDGAVSTGNNTRAYPSANNTAAPSTPVSLSRSRLLDRTQFLTPSTGSSNRTCLRISDADAFISTRSNQTSTARQQLTSTQHQSAAQGSPSRSSLSNVTPRTMNSARQHQSNLDVSPSRLPVRQRLAPGATRARRNTLLEAKPYAALEVGGDGTAPPSFAVQDQSSRPLSRRRLSTKIEELYRAKNMEKKGEEGQEISQGQEATKAMTVEANTVRELERRLTEPRAGKFSDMTRSKVAAMRRLFSPRSASPEVPCCGLDPFLDLDPISPPQKPKQIARQQESKPPKPPTPPPLPPTKATIVPKTSSTIEQIPGASEVSNVLDKIKTDVSLAASPIKVSPPKSKLIAEKVKTFETAPKSGDEAVQPRRGKALRRRLSKSLRSLFEAPSRRSREDELDKSKPVVASAKPKRALSPDGNGEISSRGSIVGRWNKLPPNAMSSGGDGTASEKRSPSLAEEGEVAEIIIKGVECGLKEPRPVRATEMKRMALLCRDRMEEIIDREKGRVSQRGKF